MNSPRHPRMTVTTITGRTLRADRPGKRGRPARRSPGETRRSSPASIRQGPLVAWLWRTGGRRHRRAGTLLEEVVEPIERHPQIPCRVGDRGGDVVRENNSPEPRLVARQFPRQRRQQRRGAAGGHQRRQAQTAVRRHQQCNPAAPRHGEEHLPSRRAQDLETIDAKRTAAGDPQERPAQSRHVPSASGPCSPHRPTARLEDSRDMGQERRLPRSVGPDDGRRPAEACEATRERRQVDLDAPVVARREPGRRPTA